MIKLDDQSFPSCHCVAVEKRLEGGEIGVRVTLGKAVALSQASG